MSRKLTFRNFLKDIGARLVAVAVAVGVFLCLGLIRRIDLPVISSIPRTETVFLTSGLLIVALIGISWIVYQQTAR